MILQTIICEKRFLKISTIIQKSISFSTTKIQFVNYESVSEVEMYE